MNLISKVFIIIFFILLYSVNADIGSYERSVSTPVTKYNIKISDFKKYLNQRNVKPIYVYIKKAVVRSSAKGKSLPLYIGTLIQSTLSEFGSKVTVLLSYSEYLKYKNKPNCYAIQGAITAYDDGIKVDSKSLNLFIKLVLDGHKNKNKLKYKIKNKISHMIGDFVVVQNGRVTDKVSSKIVIRAKTDGYRFGINILGSTLGISHYKHIEDGIEYSLRKLVEASMIDLIGKIFKVQTYHTMPEIQIKKNPEKPDSHLSNRDFCSDINKIVLYPLALSDEKFDHFGMTYESEINKLKCLKDLYTSKAQKKYKIKLNTVYGELTDRSQTYQNVLLVQKMIKTIASIGRTNILTESIANKKICDKPNNQEYCKFIENRVELQTVLR